MEGIFAIIAAVVAAVAIAMSIGAKKKWEATLTALSERDPDLLYVAGGLFQRPKVTGTLDGVPVTVDSYSQSHGKSRTIYSRVVVGSGLPPDLRLTEEGLASAFAKAFLGRDVTVGDRDFDEALVVRGLDDAETVAHLDASTREAIMYAHRLHDASFEAGELTMTVRGYASAATIDELVSAGLAVAHAAQGDGASTNTRLERMAFEDPEAGVRRRALDLLLGRLTRAEASAVARRALGNDDPLVVVRGAAMLGGAPEAVAALVAVADGLRSPSEAVVGALERLAGGGHAPSEMHLTRLAGSPVGEVRAAAARGLGVVGGPGAQGTLLELLAEDVEEVAVAAAEGLERCGDLSAVEPLMARAKGMFVASAIKRATREAVAAIQGRGSGGAGQLSLVDGAGAGGELAFADDASGLAVVAEAEAEVEVEGG